MRLRSDDGLPCIQAGGLSDLERSGGSSSRAEDTEEPGDVLVPFPELEKSIPRRNFFAGFIYMLAGLIGLPMVWPVLRFIMKPMYAPFDNRWWQIGNIGHIKAEDVGTQFKFNKLIRDSVLQINLDTNAWVIKASPATLGKIYTHGDRTFTDEKGNVLWVNDARIPYVA